MADVSDFSKVADVAKTASTISPAVQKIKEAKLLVDSIGGIMKSVETLILPFVQKMQQGQDQGSNIVQAPQEQPVQQTIAPAPVKSASTSAAGGVTPAASPPASPPKPDLDFFQSDAGMKSIINAIDNFTPLIGDIKLSEVKQALKEVIKESKEKKQ